MKNSILINNIKTNSIYEQDLYLENSSYINIFPANIPFPHKIIDILAKWGVHSLVTAGSVNPYVPSRENQGAIMEDSLKIAAEYKEKLSIAQELYSDLSEFLRLVVLSLKVGETIQVSRGNEVLRKLIDFARDNADILLHFEELHYTPKTDPHYLNIAVRTAVLVAITGIILKLRHHKLMVLVLGGLLHNIGLSERPEIIDIIESKRQYNNAEKKLLIDYVRNMSDMIAHSDINNDIINDISQGLELYDGTGIPYATMGENISLHGRIIGLCSSYAMNITDKARLKGTEAYLAITDLIRKRNKKFDPKLVSIFIKIIGLYPIGSYVKLEDSCICSVAFNNPSSYKFPIVRAVLDVNGRAVTRETYIQTSAEFKIVSYVPKLTVTKMLDK